jgi:chromosome segregation ATPase
VDKTDAGGDDRSELEQEVEESREQLRAREREADRLVEDADRLAARAAELEANEERIRRTMHEPTGPLLPPVEPPAD